MDSSADKSVSQKQRFTVTYPTMFGSNVASNDFTKQFATYWNPSTEIRYENWLQAQRKQFLIQKEYDHSIYELKSSFTCTNQFLSSFSGSPAILEDDTRCTSK